MTLGLINANPVVHAKKERSPRAADLHAEYAVDPLEIYDFLRDIRDPEHPYSLEQLSVLSEESITVNDKLGRIFSMQDNFHTNYPALQYGNRNWFVLESETEELFSSALQGRYPSSSWISCR
ncbi:unnamed protein product [Cuscuta europaea]|uniref:Uncharacterized protein n=1 Tax=Cuscuta europaea TaxID=41803 RepID=A0A9P0YLL9_CUSEU|nr:unnamed protein product [Cuscuta europaea]